MNLSMLGKLLNKYFSNFIINILEIYPTLTFSTKPRGVLTN